jgi:hypothetical protein
VLDSGFAASISSGSSTTNSPLLTSKPRTSSSQASSSPPSVQKRFSWIGAWCSLQSMRRRTSFCSVAVYSFTGMVTIPKLIAPFQIARIGR